jgi:pyroglutamyl-peptidase
MKALVTGFEPFGGDTVNPAEEAVQLLRSRIGNLEVATSVLPASFAQSAAALVRAIESTRPDIVLCVGQAGGRVALSLERVAINVQDARIPDNDRAQPIDVPVVPRGPAAYFATLPIKAAVAALRQAGLPAEVSNTAGTFVCNHILYSLMHIAAQGGHRFRGGFLHIPLLPEQAATQRGVASMALADVVRGIEIILQTAAEHAVDVRIAEGAIS